AFDTKLTVHALVAVQAPRTPDAIALVGSDGQRISYRELDARAEGVAEHLRGIGVGRGSIVGVKIGRSVEYVVALYGVLKAGAAYLPLDPGYPSERIAFVVGDASPLSILTAA